jgi:hypothetical protein
MMDIRSNARYDLRINIKEFTYTNVNKITAGKSLTFIGTKVHNDNNVPLTSALTVDASFKTPTVTTFTKQLVDGGYNKLAKLEISIDKHSNNGVYYDASNLKSHYEFNNFGINTDLQSFKDWKSYNGSNSLTTLVDTNKCATAVHNFVISDYSQIAFTAQAKASVFDHYDNSELSGDELVDVLSNFLPFSLIIDSQDNRMVDFNVDGGIKLPSKPQSDLYIKKDCINLEGIVSGYFYNDIPILGDY